MQWRQNPQRVAWVVLTTSFCTFCMLAVALPLGVRDRILHATSPRPAQLQAINNGTVQLWAPRAETASAVTSQWRPVPEGSEIVTDGSPGAFLVVSATDSAEQPLVNMQLYEDSVVRLERARTRRFRWGSEPDQVVLRLERGRLLISTAQVDSRPLAVTVRTPAADVTLSQGSYYITSQGEETQVMARLGTATVKAAGSETTANAAERVSVIAGRPPDLPVPAALNLVRNGSFGDGLGADWKVLSEIAPGQTSGQLTIESSGQRRVVHFARRSEERVPNALRIQQVLNRDVQAFSSLVLRLDVQLLYQSVPGGGVADSEYPVLVDIAYTDIYGKDLHWYQGFYCQDLPPGTSWPQPTGLKLPLGTWYSYESDNLLESLRDTRPARINSITVSATGHDYESQVADVALIVR